MIPASVIPALAQPAPVKAISDGIDESFASQVEKLVRQHLQSHMRTELIYEDGSESQEQSSDRAAAQAQLIAYLESLLACFGTGFQNWLESFLMEISPQRAEGSTDQERWSDFVTWFEELDKSFTREHFMEQSRKALKRALRQKTVT